MMTGRAMRLTATSLETENINEHACCRDPCVSQVGVGRSCQHNRVQIRPGGQRLQRGIAIDRILGGKGRSS